MDYFLQSPQWASSSARWAGPSTNSPAPAGASLRSRSRNPAGKLLYSPYGPVADRWKRSTPRWRP